MALAAVMMVTLCPKGRHARKPLQVQMISCGEAGKALALSQTDQETCFSNRLYRLPLSERTAWYAPYLEYVYERGWLEGVPADEPVTIGMLDVIGEELGLLPELNPESRAAVASFPVCAEGFWQFYRKVCEVSGSDDLVTEAVITVCGNSATVTGAPEWTAYVGTDVFTYTGLPLDSYVDQTLRVLQRDGEILHLEAVISDTVTYPNTWLVGFKDGNLRAYLYGIYREFPFPQGDDSYGEQVADVTVTKGTLIRADTPLEEIRGKVLSVTEEAIEIQGYGSVPVDENAAFYKVYGTLEMQDLSDILVGYDLERFSLREGRICAGVMTQTFRAENIRVLLRTSDFAGLFHPQVTIEGMDDYYVCYGSRKEFHGAGEAVTLSVGDACFEAGRVIIKTAQENRGLRITSIRRDQGNPVYRGTLELNCYDQGITVVNELLLEDYLKRVVPSEVPGSYGQEALEAQAICARSYGWLAIRSNALREYGAHVDDSESYQVYNNLNESGSTTAAVQNTYGQVLAYEGQVVPAYYFSTSWGSTTDPSIWGSDPGGVPYLRPVEVTSSGYAAAKDGDETAASGEKPDYSNEGVFREAMNQPPQDAYERDCEWFRWTVDVTLEQLTQSLKRGLPERAAADGNRVLYGQADGSFVAAASLETLPLLGDVVSVEISRRAGGGSVQELVITGTDSTVKLVGQGNVRNLLGNTDYVYQNGKGISSGNRELLQSAFFWLEELREEDVLTGYRIHGGGKGHGLGIPQNGMNAMSQAGLSAENILEYFYPGTAVETMY